MRFPKFCACEAVLELPFRNHRKMEEFPRVLPRGMLHGAHAPCTEVYLPPEKVAVWMYACEKPAGGPLKPAFGLSGAVPWRAPGAPQPARASWPSTPTQFPPGPRIPWRSAESCSTPTPLGPGKARAAQSPKHTLSLSSQTAPLKHKPLEWATHPPCTRTLWAFNQSRW